MSKLNQKIDLICPAGNLPTLRAAVDNGADAIYIGFRDGTNARNFPGLNFSPEEARQGIHYARQNGASVFLAMNTYPQPEQWNTATQAIDMAAEIDVDALILADPGLMNYCKKTHPQLRLHLSVQGSATNRDAICFYHEQFNIQRVVLPRVLSLTQVSQVIKEVPVEVEVFGYGSLCVMVEGRCALSSYVTGDSPNTAGVCSPAHAVRWKETAEGRQSYLNDVLIERYENDDPAGYPTLCKGRFYVEDNLYHAIEEPTSLNLLELLPDLMACGVKAIKVEGRQRSKAYVSKVTRILRQALDACFSNPDNFVADADWIEQLNMLGEGSCHTLGAYTAMAMKISVGPISYFWERQKVFDFYKGLEETAVDIVYLGETICSKRREVTLADWLEIADQLSKAGKEVVLSTLTLIEAASELSLQSRIAKNGQYTVEANDMAAIHKLGGQQPFVIGPHINTYNSDTLELFNDMGACRWVIPVELGNETISKMQQKRPAGMETEIFAFGNLPLAFSARCYTARAHNRPKDSCGFICLDYPDGLPMYTQEKEPFLILNGIQTQSVVKQNLVTLLDDVNELEIDIIRIMPQSEGTPEIIEIFHKVLTGNIQADTALEQLETFHLFGKCNGYWFGEEGMAWISNPRFRSRTAEA